MTNSSATPAASSRDKSNKEIDASALRAIAQAAVSVELFTIPLYMTGLYSIQGMHEINSKGATWYKGRQWPGKDTSRQMTTIEDYSFDCIFSVFIDEMLHLQMAANICNAVGQKPTFTSSALQNPNNTWKCYGPNQTVIPHIIDLTDVQSYADVKVNLNSMTKDQLRLFLAIEEPTDTAKKKIKPAKLKDYFPPTPFADWKVGYTELNLKMFGTIGYMYECLDFYATLTYSDGSTLWDHVFKAGSLQRDLFNSAYSGHPANEYPKFQSFLPNDATAATALPLVLDMIKAITDQGEGSTQTVRPHLIAAARENLKTLAGGEILKQATKTGVENKYQPDEAALTEDYPSYNESGQLEATSADAEARCDWGSLTHYERFSALFDLFDDAHALTWDVWFKNGHAWSGDLLKTSTYDPNHNKKLPTPEAIAQALNNLKKDPKTNFPLLSGAVLGSIAGVTDVLNQYWTDSTIGFPMPAMYGAASRISTIWSTLGVAPDLTLALPAPPQYGLWNACQGLSMQFAGTNDCAIPANYHSCKGSNTCTARGGCGFVHSISGGGLCGAQFQYKGLHGTTDAAAAGPLYSAPGNNKCSGFGGCGAPISASQVFPNSGTMQLYRFDRNNSPIPSTTMDFTAGELVYDVAYRAFTKIRETPGVTPPPPPKPNDLRIAFPPST